MYRDLDLKIMRKAVNEMIENDEYKKIAEEKTKWEKINQRCMSGKTIAASIAGGCIGVGIAALPAAIGSDDFLGCLTAGGCVTVGSMMTTTVVSAIAGGKIGKCNNKIDNMLFNRYRVNVEAQDLINVGLREEDAKEIAEVRVMNYTQSESDEHYNNLIKAVKVYEVVNDTKFSYKDYIGEEVQEETFETKEIESVDYLIDDSSELGE